MEDEILNLLQTFGWSEGFHIPIANEENRHIETLIEECLNRKDELDSELNDAKTHYECMKNFNDDLIIQRTQNGQILKNYIQQLQFENQDLKVLQFEKEALVDDVKDLDKETNQLVKDNQRLQNELELIKNECESLRQNIEWSGYTDCTLEENLQQENHILHILDKHNLQGQIEFERMELKRLNLLAEVNEYEQLIERNQTGIACAEREINKLDCLVEDSKRERYWLVEQWDNSVKILRFRDEELEIMLQILHTIQKSMRETDIKVMEQRSFFKELKRNNMELEIEIRHVLWETANYHQIKEKITECATVLTNNKTEYNRELTSLGIVILEEESLNNQLQHEINKKNDISQLLEIECEKLTSLLDNLKNQSIYSVDGFSQLEKIMKEEKQQHSTATQDRLKYGRLLQNLKCNMTDLETKCFNTESELKQIRNLNTKIIKKMDDLDENLQRQAEITNSIEIEIKQNCAKLQFLKDEKSVELKLELEKKTLHMIEEYNKKKKILDMIAKEVMICNNHITTQNKENACFNEKIKNLADFKKQLNLQIEANEKYFYKIDEENKEISITENMLRVKIDNLGRDVNSTGQEVFSLEKQKVIFETLLREHMLEIDSSEKLLNIRKRALNEGISLLKKCIDQKNAQISQLMNKYEILVETSKKGNNGDPITTENYKLQIIKERYSLIEKGDDLEAKIKTTENDIQAMENTLILMNACNNSFKDNVLSLNFKTEEWKDRDKAEKEFNRLLSVLKTNKSSIQKIKEDIHISMKLMLKQELRKKTNDLEIQNQELENINREKEQCLSKLEHNLNEQYVKLNRVEIRIKTLKKSLKKTINVDTIEKGYLTKELLKINKSVLSYITKLVFQCPEMKDKVNSYLNEKELHYQHGERNLQREALKYQLLKFQVNVQKLTMKVENDKHLMHFLNSFSTLITTYFNEHQLWLN